MHPLIDEAMKRAPVAWVAVLGRPAFPVWCLWIDDSLYVVSGKGEQAAPGLRDATSALVTARGDHGGRVVTWPAAVALLRNATDDFTAVAGQLAAKRLNSAGTDELVSRWAHDCVINRLTPAGAPVEQGATLPDASLAAPPSPSPAVSETRRPFRLHRVRGAARPRD